MRVLFLALLVGTILVAPDCQAQNLVPNPDFDVDVSGWEIQANPAEVFLEWDSDNAGAGSPGSGSLSLSGADSTNPFGNYARAYSVDSVSVPPGAARIELMGAVKIPFGQPPSSDADIRAGLFSEPDCLSGFLGLWVTPGFAEIGTTGQWANIGLFSNIPEGVACALLELVAETPIDDPLPAALFDRLTLRFWSITFADGFETGNTSTWSSVNP